MAQDRTKELKNKLGSYAKPILNFAHVIPPRITEENKKFLEDLKDSGFLENEDINTIQSILIKYPNDSQNISADDNSTCIDIYKKVKQKINKEIDSTTATTKQAVNSGIAGAGTTWKPGYYIKQAGTIAASARSTVFAAFKIAARKLQLNKATFTPMDQKNSLIEEIDKKKTTLKQVKESLHKSGHLSQETFDQKISQCDELKKQIEEISEKDLTTAKLLEVFSNEKYQIFNPADYSNIVARLELEEQSNSSMLRR